MHYLLSKNYMSTQERPSGEKSCIKALDFLNFDTADTWVEYYMTSENAAICLSILNYLGVIYESLGDHEKSKERLHQAEKVFQTYGNQFYFSPKNVDFIMRSLCGKQIDLDEKERRKEFENSHTYTLYYLAQVYKNIGDFTVAACYCEKTLVRQLESGEYDFIDWSLNCATLSQYYFSKSDCGNFAQARHCLASAEAVIKHAESDAETKIESSSGDTMELEKIHSTKADIYRCWARYGIALLEASKSQVLSCDSADENSDSQSKDVSFSQDASMAELSIKFSGINLGDLENQVSCKLVRTFPEARHVFLKTQGWLNKAKEFYTLNEFASSHVELVQDMSRLYKALVFFEAEVDRKCKMHKRRLDMLSEILGQLSQTHYLMVCRQLMFEIGETANEMLSLKLDVMEEKAEVDNPQATPTPHQVHKVNFLAEHSVKHFQRFIDTYRDNTGILPNKFPDESLRPILLCRFYMGRLWNKKLTSDPREKLSFLAKSLQEYRALVNYVEETHPESVECVRNEYEACRDMVNLLPMKMSRIQERLL